MSTDVETLVSKPLAPLASSERITALDVIRGFALIGILLMNIEYFNRPTTDIGTGLQAGQSGANFLFSFFVLYFVTGKFWTMFSLLFGMGFGVMLTRAQSAGRSFLKPYMRRIAALALFGALHFILLWAGDILFSYSVGALALLVVLYGRGKYILAAIAVCVGLGFVPGMDWAFGIAGSLVFFGLCAWYLRGPERVILFKRSVPIFKIVVGLLITAGTGALLAGLLLPEVPHQGRVAMPIMGTSLIILGVLMARFHNPVELRTRRMAVGIYCFMAFTMTAMGAGQYFFPDPAKAAEAKQEAAAAAKPATPAPIAAADAKPALAAAAEASAKASLPVPAKPGAKADDKKPLTAAEKAAKEKKDRAEALAKRKAAQAEEIRVLTKGTYSEHLALRTKTFLEHAPNQFGFAMLIISMFLLGLWFVRSGIMADTKAHLPLFRKLAFIGIPVGVGLGLAGSLIAMHGDPGSNNGFMFAFGLLTIGNLPACLGYASAMVLLLHSRSMSSTVSVLAPFGRMALTNYLTHSLVLSTLFFSWGFGLYGIERIYQLLVVIALVAVQIPFCHWWLARFRYGPVEWLWRAITYWQIPAMRVMPADNATAMPSAA